VVFDPLKVLMAATVTGPRSRAVTCGRPAPPVAELSRGGFDASPQKCHVWDTQGFGSGGLPIGKALCAIRTAPVHPVSR
jgi:hypothetical protein